STSYFSLPGSTFRLFGNSVGNTETCLQLPSFLPHFRSSRSIFGFSEFSVPWLGGVPVTVDRNGSARAESVTLKTILCFQAGSCRKLPEAAIPAAEEARLLTRYVREQYVGPTEAQQSAELKWCAWVAVYCSFISFANSRSSEDTKQMMSSFMLSISAVVMSYLQNPQPMTPPW
uniref:PAT complex subunit Asterix n=1 Tax=Bos taurus TaxID=9913 RepID=A0A3Q1LRE0_BOVIN